jgi:hypothetical protein
MNMKTQKLFVVLAFSSIIAGSPAIAHAPRVPLIPLLHPAPAFTPKQLRALLILQIRSSRQTASLALFRRLSNRNFVFNSRFNAKALQLAVRPIRDERALASLAGETKALAPGGRALESIVQKDELLAIEKEEPLSVERVLHQIVELPPTETKAVLQTEIALEAKNEERVVVVEHLFEIQPKLDLPEVKAAEVQIIHSEVIEIARHDDLRIEAIDLSRVLAPKEPIVATRVPLSIEQTIADFERRRALKKQRDLLLALDRVEARAHGGIFDLFIDGRER